VSVCICSPLHVISMIFFYRIQLKLVMYESCCPTVCTEYQGSIVSVESFIFIKVCNYICFTFRSFPTLNFVCIVIFFPATSVSVHAATFVMII
jgi:hypothetical protein